MYAVGLLMAFTAQKHEARKVLFLVVLVAVMSMMDIKRHAACAVMHAASLARCPVPRPYLSFDCLPFRACKVAFVFLVHADSYPALLRKCGKKVIRGETIITCLKGG